MPPSGYLTSAGIESVLVHIASTHPALATLITLPEPSHEGRAMHAVRISSTPAGHGKGVLVVAGLHARELVNPDATAGFALRLCQAYATNTDLVFGGKVYAASTVQLVLDALDVYVLPLVNPDGRAFVQAAGGDPWWRKNRRSSPGVACRGVDLNRNFDFLWSSGIGTSSDPCDYQVYKGPAAFAEPETRGVRWLLDTYPVVAFMDIHSYSQLVLYPWGDDDSQSTNPAMNFANPAYDGMRGHRGDSIYQEYIPAADLTWFADTGARIHDAIAAVAGHSYTVEAAVGLYPTSGTSDDYAYARHLATAGARKVQAFAVETGTEFQPAFPAANQVMAEAMAAAMELCVATLCVVEDTSTGRTYADRLREPEAPEVGAPDQATLSPAARAPAEEPASAGS